MPHPPAVLLPRIREQLDRMAALAGRPDDALFQCASGSAWCAAEHLDHLVKVNRSILRLVVSPDSPRLDTGLRFLGRLVLTLGWIPRGRGRAPAKMVGTKVTGADLRQGMEEIRAMLPAPAASLDEKTPVVRHPVFGGLTRPQALRFIDVHNEHHLKIIREILAIHHEP